MCFKMDVKLIFLLTAVAITFASAISRTSQTTKIKSLERRVRILESKYHLQAEEVSILREDFYKINSGHNAVPQLEAIPDLPVNLIMENSANETDETNKIARLLEAFQQEKQERLLMKEELEDLKQKCNEKTFTAVGRGYNSRNMFRAGQQSYQYENLEREVEILKTQVYSQNARLKISFSAFINETLTLAGLFETVVFNSVRTNDGSAYSSETGRFVAPIPGTYVFHLNIYALPGTPHTAVALIKNKEPIMSVSFGKNNTYVDSNMVVLHLDAGDTVQTMTLLEVFILVSKWCNFSGFLLYPD